MATEWVIKNNEINPIGSPLMPDFSLLDIKHIYKIEDNKLKNQGPDVLDFQGKFSKYIMKISEDGKSIETNSIDVANFEEEFSNYIWHIDSKNQLQSNILNVSNFKKEYNIHTLYVDEYYKGTSEVMVGASMESLGAFSNNKAMKGINIPNFINNLGDETFSHSNLKEAHVHSDIVYDTTTFPKDCEIISDND